MKPKLTNRSIRYIIKVEGTDLSPHSIPDGFYKLLAILAAIKVQPKVLLIYEVERSLHAEIVKCAIAELSACDSRVIVTSHSPLLIDAVNLEHDAVHSVPRLCRDAWHAPDTWHACFASFHANRL